MDKKEALQIIRKNWPEGYNKIKEALEFLIPELSESTEEKIKRGLFEGMKALYNEKHATLFGGVKVTEILAWLEKQKKVPTEKERQYIQTLQHLISSWRQGKQEYDKDYYDNIEKWLSSRHVEQKPAEWSEEDEKIRHDIECAIHFFLNEGSAVCPAADTTKEVALDWLKSLKNRGNFPKNNTNSLNWKPSEEQIEGLDCAIKTLKYQLNVGDKRLDSLYEQLKQL